MSRLVPLLSLAMLFAAAPVHAQNPRRPLQQPNLNRLPDLTIQNGEVKDVKNDMLYVVNGEQSYYVKMMPAKALITGPAMPDVLANGMFVNFTVKLDAKLNSEEPIAQLEVFTPSEVKPLGTQAEGDKTYVAGQIASLNKTGKISVKTPKGVVRGELAPDCKITLVINDPSVVKFIRPGDTVMIHGKLTQPSLNNMPGTAVGSEFEITLNPNEPLTLAKKKPARLEDKPKGGDAPKASEGEKNKTAPVQP